MLVSVALPRVDGDLDITLGAEVGGRGGEGGRAVEEEPRLSLDTSAGSAFEDSS